MMADQAQAEATRGGFNQVVGWGEEFCATRCQGPQSKSPAASVSVRFSSCEVLTRKESVEVERCGRAGRVGWQDEVPNSSPEFKRR